jgi:hypothetical protein
MVFSLDMQDAASACRISRLFKVSHSQAFDSNVKSSGYQLDKPQGQVLVTIHSSSKLVKTRNTEQKRPVGGRNGTRINTNSRLAFVSGKCGRHFVAFAAARPPGSYKFLIQARGFANIRLSEKYEKVEPRLMLDEWAVKPGPPSGRRRLLASWGTCFGHQLSPHSAALVTSPPLPHSIPRSLLSLCVLVAILT